MRKDPLIAALDMESSRSCNSWLEARIVTLEAFIILQSSFGALKYIIGAYEICMFGGNVFCKIDRLIVYIAHLHLLNLKVSNFPEGSS